jgi:hypothetical protein
VSTYFDKEKTWPKKRFNLICGASAAGKTRWIMPRLVDLHRSGVYVLYTCCDRSIADAQETLTSMGYPADALPMESFQNEDESLNFDFNGLRLLIQGHKFMRRKPIDILFVESIGVLAKDMNSAKHVVEFSRQINTLMAAENLSVWGSSWCTKVREDSKFVRTRDNVMGSAAWPGICGTIIYIDSPNGDTQPERSVTIMPRNSPMRVEECRFNGRGVLEPYTRVTLDALLLGGGTIFRSDIEAQCELMSVDIKTGERWLKRMQKEKKLEYIRRGEYRVL